MKDNEFSHVFTPNRKDSEWAGAAGPSIPDNPSPFFNKSPGRLCQFVMSIGNGYGVLIIDKAGGLRLE